MKCPIDHTDLIMTDRQGVEIDYCPTCRGVWLDRGELDKLIDRSMTWTGREDRDDDDVRMRRVDDDDYRRRYGDEAYYRRKRKKSFLGELFDFD